jgi:hypothetical protein
MNISCNSLVIRIITHLVNKACDAAPTELPKFYTLHVQAVTKPTLFTDKKF